MSEQLVTIAVLVACGFVLLPDWMTPVWLFGKVGGLFRKATEKVSLAKPASKGIDRDTALRYLDEIAMFAPDCCREKCEQIAVEIVKHGFSK